MLLPRLELKFGETSVGGAGQVRFGAVEIHFAVDENTVCLEKDGATNDVGRHGVLYQWKIGRMKPVVHHDGAKVDIIVGLCWAIYDHRSLDRANILSTVMRMPPRRSVLIGSKAIGEGGVGCNWTLGDPWHTIIPLSLSLEEAMPILHQLGAKIQTKAIESLTSARQSLRPQCCWSHELQSSLPNLL